MKTILKIAVFMISMPLIGSILIKPHTAVHDTSKNDISVIDSKFRVIVHEEKGDFCYMPEEIVEWMTVAQIPKDIVFSESEDYVEISSQSSYDSEQEYLKALAIMLRTNLVYVWEREGCPEKLDFNRTGLCIKYPRSDNMDKGEYIKRKKAKSAADATKGVVITKEKKVIAAPFFTSSESSMLIAQAGDGVGFSLNYAYRLAKDGKDFYKILQFFYNGISVEIYE